MTGRGCDRPRAVRPRSAASRLGPHSLSPPIRPTRISWTRAHCRNHDLVGSDAVSEMQRSISSASGWARRAPEVLSGARPAWRIASAHPVRARIVSTRQHRPRWVTLGAGDSTPRLEVVLAGRGECPSSSAAHRRAGMINWSSPLNTGCAAKTPRRSCDPPARPRPLQHVAQARPSRLRAPSAVGRSVRPDASGPRSHAPFDTLLCRATSLLRDQAGDRGDTIQQPVLRQRGLEAAARITARHGVQRRSVVRSRVHLDSYARANRENLGRRVDASKRPRSRRDRASGVGVLSGFVPISALTPA